MNASFLSTLIIGLCAIAGLLFLLSLTQLRRGRTSPYWRMRRAAGQRGGQLFLLSMALFVLAFILAFFGGFLDFALDQQNSPAPTADVQGTVDAAVSIAIAETSTALFEQLLGAPTVGTPTAGASPTPSTGTPTAHAATTTPTATITASPTATATPTATVTPSATPSPAPTFASSINLTPPPNSLPAADDAQISITALSDEINADWTAPDIKTTFPASTRRIYVFVEFAGMADGVGYVRALYHNGAVIQASAHIWRSGASGATFFFFGSANGYPSGSYEIRLLLNGTTAASAAFTIGAP